MEPAQARLSIHLSKCHIVGNQMLRLIYLIAIWNNISNMYTHEYVSMYMYLDIRLFEFQRLFSIFSYVCMLFVIVVIY